MIHKKILLAICLGFTFGVSNAQAQISPQAANAQLSKAAIQKIQQGKIDINALLKNTSNDLIVEYYNNADQNLNAAQLRTYFQQQKRIISNQFAQPNSGVQLLRDYNALPISFYRIQNRNALVSLLNNPNVKAVYPNRVSKATLSQSLNQIGQPVAKTQGFTGAGTTVAVLDTGANYRHPDLGSCTAPGTPASCRVSYALDFAPEDNSLDDNGHGSNVSSIVAGVASEAKIVALDVFRGASAYDSDIISALNWVTNQAETLNIKSANLSLGNSTRYSSTCTSSSLTNSFQKLRNVGVIPVVASGNDAYTNGISYPACTAGAVSVGAVYDANVGGRGYQNCSDQSTYMDKVTCFSNSASNLTLLAPGAPITAGGIPKVVHPWQLHMLRAQLLCYLQIMPYQMLA